MSHIRVLIVDDSAVVRRMLTDILSAEADIEVIGAAPNAALARSRFEASQPDVVTLDVELPDTSGLELLTELRKKAPALPIIMFSSLTQRAAATTLDALSRGASDYVTKPTQVGSREEAIAHIRHNLVPKIRALATRRRVSLLPKTPSLRPGVATTPRTTSRLSVLAIGTSTGGPNALSEVFRALPGNLSVPIVLVQHMPPLFTRLLAERLTAESKIPVKEAANGDVLEPGKAYIAPGDFHMRVVRQGLKVVVALDQSPPEHSCRPAVDVLFRSVVQIYGAQTLAVILTGMGYDGLRGCELIRAAGGQIVAQDEATSIVWGMPGAVARAGIADAIVPLGKVAGEIHQRVLASDGARNQEQKSA